MKNKLIGGVLLSAMALSLLAGCGPKPTIGDPEPAPKPDHGYVEIPKMDENNISPDEESELTVHYLPEGYAIAVSSGQAALLGGCSEADVGTVAEALGKFDVEKLNFIVVPNSEESRWTGVSALREQFGENLVVTSRAEGSDAYEEFKTSIGNMLLTVGTGSSFNVGTALFQVLGPVVEDTETPMDASLVLWTECGEESFLFADDATEWEVKSILADGADMKARYIFLNSRGETTLPYSAVQQLSPWEFILADDAAEPNLGKESPASILEMNGKTYSVAAAGSSDEPPEIEPSET